MSYAFVVACMTISWLLLSMSLDYVASKKERLRHPKVLSNQPRSVFRCQTGGLERPGDCWNPEVGFFIPVPAPGKAAPQANDVDTDSRDLVYRRPLRRLR